MAAEMSEEIERSGQKMFVVGISGPKDDMIQAERYLRFIPDVYVSNVDIKKRSFGEEWFIEVRTPNSRTAMLLKLKFH